MRFDEHIDGSLHLYALREPSKKGIPHEFVVEAMCELEADTYGNCIYAVLKGKDKSGGFSYGFDIKRLKTCDATALAVPFYSAAACEKYKELALLKPAVKAVKKKLRKGKPS